MSIKIERHICTNSPCFKAGRTIKPTGAMIHSIGVPQPDPMVIRNNFNKPTSQACTHGVMGTAKVMIQCLDWIHRGWHAGGKANDTHIGIELTEPATIKYTGGASFQDMDPAKTKAHVLATYQNAVEFFAWFCSEYGLDPLKDGVIISHSEGFKRGVASNHGDVEHLWSRFGLTMNQFRKDIKAEMTKGAAPAPTKALYRVRKSAQDAASQLGAYSVLKNAISKAQGNPGYSVYNEKGEQVYPQATSAPPAQEIPPASGGFKPYLVKINTAFLNYRRGPGVNFPIGGVVKFNEVFTIIGERAGWGELKSGAGWINLKYTKRI